MSASLSVARNAPFNVPASRLPEAMRIAREIASDPHVSQSVRDIAEAVIRRHGLPIKLHS